MPEDFETGFEDEELEDDGYGFELDEDLELDETSDDDEGGEEEVDEVERRVNERLARAQAELAEAIARGDVNNEVYKGLQRHLNQRDRKLAEAEQVLADYANRLREYEDRFGDFEDVATWQAETLLDALPETDRVSAESKLTQRRLQRQQQREHQRAQGVSQSYQAQQQAEAMQRMWEERSAQFNDGLKQIAKAAGVEPDGLDYGDPNEEFITRQAKFHTSLSKAIEAKQKAALEDDVDSVRRKRKPVATRSGGGASLSASSGKSRFEAGADALLAEIRKASR